MRRYALPVLLTLALLPLASGVASAKGIPLKGQILDSNKGMTLTTGNCSCDTNWFTLGVRPGPVQISAALKTYDMGFGFSYAVRVTVLQGGQSVAYGQAACSVKQKHCNQVARIRFQAKSRAIYYLRVEGPGAEGVRYILDVLARFQPLHCSKGCSLT